MWGVGEEGGYQRKFVEPASTVGNERCLKDRQLVGADFVVCMKRQIW